MLGILRLNFGARNLEKSFGAVVMAVIASMQVTDSRSEVVLNNRVNLG